MRVIKASMEKSRNEEAGKTGDHRENPPTSGINRPGIEPDSPWWEASRLTTQPPRPQLGRAILLREWRCAQENVSFLVKNYVIDSYLYMGNPGLHDWESGALADRFNQYPWEVSGKFEGDIVFPSGIQPANGLIVTRPRWPNGTVPYVLDPIFGKYLFRLRCSLQIFPLNYSAFRCDPEGKYTACIEEFHQRTCIRLRPSTPYDRDYVYVSGYSSGCWSYVGRLNGGQMLNLQIPGCFRHGTIVHEFLHALGFYHQQSTHNRDDYVTIVWENIRSGERPHGETRLQASAAVVERLRCSPSTEANRGPLPYFRKWESCRTMRPVGGFSMGSPVSPASVFRSCSILTSFHLHRLSRPRS
ncbi:hypothetical protein PR048_019420 [Dryococelus australis]|uniref:Metalloendopeptidase n=1 Tax=Dryococelus australis TaxID=614101 RepID=A0ABQ9H3K1_9NEOP|nr:hypothetical protein PR048_019420 [Dryococelus australis]